MIGQHLRKARQAAGLTQEQVARRAGISREYVSKLETGAYHPTLDVFVRLAAALGVKAWVLLRRFEETGPQG